MIKPELSKANEHRISKHKYYELKHFCLQYHEWKTALLYLDPTVSRNRPVGGVGVTNTSSTEWVAMRRLYLKKNIELVERTAMKTDQVIGKYLLEGVTKGLSYDTLSMMCGIPCGRQKYYELYREFFWLLAREH